MCFSMIAKIIVLKFAINISKNFIDIGFFVHHRTKCQEFLLRIQRCKRSSIQKGNRENYINIL